MAGAQGAAARRRPRRPERTGVSDASGSCACRRLDPQPAGVAKSPPVPATMRSRPTILVVVRPLAFHAPRSRLRSRAPRERVEAGRLAGGTRIDETRGLAVIDFEPTGEIAQRSDCGSEGRCRAPPSAPLSDRAKPNAATAQIDRRREFLATVDSTGERSDKIGGVGLRVRRVGDIVSASGRSGKWITWRPVRPAPAELVNSYRLRSTASSSQIRSLNPKCRNIARSKPGPISPRRLSAR